MNTLTENILTGHQGKGVRYFREKLNITQADLATQINLPEEAISQLEEEDKLDDEFLAKIANVLNIPVDAIKGYTEESAVNIISNTFQDESTANINSTNHFKCTFNPLDKVVELYERIISEKDKKIGVLQERLKEKNK